MLTSTTLRGVYPAIVTPFSADGSKVDFDSLKRLVHFVLGGGAAGIVVCGSTGEAATLSDAEYHAVVRAAREYAGKGGACIAGIGTNNTARAAQMAAELEDAGLDGLMVVAPAYNKPPQSGIVAHFREVRRATKLPIIAYNVPGRTAVNILPATVAQLVSDGIIIGLKEASGSVDQALDILAKVGGKLALLSGEDSLTQALMATGAQGVISVAANVFPAECAAVVRLMAEGAVSQAAALQLKLLPLIRSMFMETNPIPVKTALALRRVIASPTLRLPLVAAEGATVARLNEVIAGLERDAGDFSKTALR